jgi:hypothetical protein
MNLNSPIKFQLLALTTSAPNMGTKTKIKSGIALGAKNATAIQEFFLPLPLLLLLLLLLLMTDVTRVKIAPPLQQSAA